MTEFIQGKQTRWGLAWTFRSDITANIMAVCVLFDWNSREIARFINGKMEKFTLLGD